MTGHDVEPADLVTNNGTSEHIFDQRAVFENAHNMTKCVTGVMIHCLPFSPWLNHGFYNYNPVLFRDLAAANEYQVMLMAIANRWGKDLIPLGPEGFVEKRPTELEEKFKQVLPGGDAFVISILKKVKDVQFRTPFQGKYQKDIADKGLKACYSTA